MFICFFVEDSKSPYYSSEVFTKVIQKISLPFELKQTESRLKLVARGIDTLEKAHTLLAKLK